MKRYILFRCLSITILCVFSLSPIYAQVKIGTNPTQVIPGAKLQVDGDNTTVTLPKFLITGTGLIGINTAIPGTYLDVNGAITNRETAVAVAANAATVPANTSQVRLTGAATATIAITAAAAPNAGQRLIIYNNTTGGFNAMLNGFIVTNGYAVEFIYSNGGWRTTDNGVGTLGNPNNWNILGNGNTNAATNFIGTTNAVDFVTRTNNTERLRITSAGNVGIAATAPVANLEIGSSSGSIANPSIRLQSNGNVFGSGGVLQFRETGGDWGINIRHQAQSDAANAEGIYFNRVVSGTEATTPILLLDQVNQRVGINTNLPGTDLDVNGAITNRETAVAVAANAATVPANTSQVRLTGAATATIAITAAAAPNAGQRLIIYNNTTGGFNATLNSFIITNGYAVEFIYSNGGWRTTDNGVGTLGNPNNWNILGNGNTNAATNFIGTTNAVDFVTRTNNTERMRITSGGNVGIGLTNPQNMLHVKAASNPLRLEGLQAAGASDTEGSLVADANGVVKMQNSSTVSAVRVTGSSTITVNNTEFFTDAGATPTEAFDNLNEFSGHRFTATKAGLYLVNFQASYIQKTAAIETDGYIGYATIDYNTNLYARSSTKIPVPETGGAAASISTSVSTLIKLAAGDNLDFIVQVYGATSTGTGAAAVNPGYTINVSRVD